MNVAAVDCRGLACPNPVLKTKERIEEGAPDQVVVLVDNPAASENVGRFLQRMGYRVTTAERDGALEVTGTRLEGPSECEIAEKPAPSDSERKIAVMIGTQVIGSGDDSLGGRLMVNLLATLKEMGRELWRLIFLNGGVKLTVSGSECLPHLQELEREGVPILVCGTCLNHFGLLDEKRVGETTNMLDIVTALQLADKVLSFT